jgi:hypothetical protein
MRVFDRRRTKDSFSGGMTGKSVPKTVLSFFSCFSLNLVSGDIKISKYDQINVKIINVKRQLASLLKKNLRYCLTHELPKPITYYQLLKTKWPK